MSKFEKCLLYALLILAGLSNLAAIGQVKDLEARIAALESREPVTASAGVPRRAGSAGGRQAPPLFTSGKAGEGPAKPGHTATFTAYAYCACEKCCGKWAQYGLTATGTVPEQGRTVAVDPDVSPLGSQLWIDGVGGYVSEDTGSGIGGHTIDIYHETHAAALEWGKRQVTVTWEAP